MDVTFNKIGWEVSEKEFLTDHKLIYIDLEIDRNRVEDVEKGIREKGWIFKEDRIEELGKEIAKELEEMCTFTAEELEEKMDKACDAVLRRRMENNKRKPVFWWSEEIACMRRKCIGLKRKMQRCGKEEGKLRKAKGEYSKGKKILQKEIVKAKREAWKDLIREAEQNIWGDAYRIVSNKLKRRKLAIPKERMERVVAKLFPEHQDFVREKIEVEEEEVPRFTEVELELALKRLKKGKAPGPDGFVTEMVKIAAKVAPGVILEVMNRMITTGSFADNWKTAKLVLIKKPGKDLEDPSAYRPICLLSIFAKLAEHLLSGRLGQEVEEKETLSERQYGFRKGRSTVGAIREVLEGIEKARNRPDASRLIPCIVTLDVSNAFNSASWKLILDKIREMEVPKYLRRVLNSYLEKRKIIIRTEETEKEVMVNSGVPQGSVLGPTLWNLLYNRILEIELPRGVFSIAYADDLVLVAAARDPESLKRKVEDAIGKIMKGMEELRLNIAREKTEIVVVRGRRRIPDVNFDIGGREMESIKVLKYLGVWLDDKMSFRDHIDKLVVRTAEVVNNLNKMLPNIGGPGPLKRKLLATVVNSIMAYGVEAWHKALGKKKERIRLEGIQRRMALRVVSGYRTASTEATLVLAGIFPIHLVAEEKRRIYEGAPAGEEREKLWSKWQEEWERTERWTRKLIPRIRPWIERNSGELDHFAAQFFLGHGCFGSYLKRFGIADTDRCVYCGQTDTPAHTILACDRWIEERRLCYEDIGALTAGNLVSKMLSSEEKWKKIHGLISGIMRKKNKEERDLRLEREREMGDRHAEEEEEEEESFFTAEEDERDEEAR